MLGRWRSGKPDRTIVAVSVAYTTSISGRQRSLIEFFADDTVLAGKILSKDFRFGIDDDVDVAWRCSVTSLERWCATAGKPIVSNNSRNTLQSLQNRHQGHFEPTRLPEEQKFVWTYARGRVISAGEARQRS
jgi:hypothetical protein